MAREDESTEVDPHEPIWYPAVEQASDLPKLAEPGARCRVLSEGTNYLYIAGTWQSLGAPSRPPKT